MPRIGDHAKRSWGWARKAVSSAVGLVLLTAAVTYLITVRANSINAEQQQHLAALQQFISTGADVDANVTDLVDAAGDRSDVEIAKRNVRHAIAAHAAAAKSVEEVVGRANITAYIDGLGKLRTLVDDSNDPVAALQTSQARFDVMHNRTLIVAEARKHIY